MVVKVVMEEMDLEMEEVDLKVEKEVEMVADLEVVDLVVVDLVEVVMVVVEIQQWRQISKWAHRSRKRRLPVSSKRSQRILNPSPPDARYWHKGRRSGKRSS